MQICHLQRQGRHRRTTAARNTSSAALGPVHVQLPEQPLDHGHFPMDHTDDDQHLLSIHSASTSSLQPVSVSHLFTRAAAEDTQHDPSGTHESISTANVPGVIPASDGQHSAEEEAARCSWRMVPACLEAACTDQHFHAHFWQHEMPWRLQWCGQLQCAHRSL